jgi:hypothetical protein
MEKCKPVSFRRVTAGVSGLLLVAYGLMVFLLFGLPPIQSQLEIFLAGVHSKQQGYAPFVAHTEQRTQKDDCYELNAGGCTKVTYTLGSQDTCGGIRKIFEQDRYSNWNEGGKKMGHWRATTLFEQDEEVESCSLEFLVGRK